MKRVAVVGASGFVGTALTERLVASGTAEVVPIIHSSGNAWRLLRMGIPLKIVDLHNRSELDKALEGCTHIVNCSRGDESVMIKGFKNLLDAARSARVQTFVHLSSVAVYGDPPHPQSVSEDAPTNPMMGTYGGIKLQQDRMTQSAAKAGLPSIILCPPNIGGPYSYFFLQVLEALRKGTFVLLAGQPAVCNLVDAANLSYAIELSLDKGSHDAPRVFVTDDEPTTWMDVVDGLMPLLKGFPRPPLISREEMISLRPDSAPRSQSLKRTMLHLVSSDVREAMRRDPNLAKVDGLFRRATKVLGSTMEDRLRVTVEGPVKIRPISFDANVARGLSVQQLRGVRHSCDLAKRVLAYKPLVTVQESLEAFCKWQRETWRMDIPEDWALLRHVYR